MGASVAWRVRLVVHPLTIASVVLLAANDAWFKAWWPGLATGKLSDLAGVWMVGALAVAALGSVRWGAALTALGFALLKTVPSVAVLAAPVLGGVTRRDPTDLVALLVLWPLGRLAQHLGAQRPPHVNDAWSTIGAAFVVTAAAFTTSATSCFVEPSVGDIMIVDGEVVFHYGGDSADQAQVAWYAVDGDGYRRAEAPSGQTIRKELCVPSGCYSVVDGKRVTLDGTTIFEYEDFRYKMANRKRECGGPRPFGSIAVQPGADGDELWIAMGASGILHRSATGEWEERAVFEAVPPPARSEVRTKRAVLWLLPLLIGAVAGPVLMTSARFFGSRRRALAIAAVTVLVNGVWAFVSYRWITLIEFGAMPTMIMIIVLIWLLPLLLAQCVWLTPLVLTQVRSRRRPLRPASWAPPVGPSPFG